MQIRSLHIYQESELQRGKSIYFLNLILTNNTHKSKIVNYMFIIIIIKYKTQVIPYEAHICIEYVSILLFFLRIKGFLINNFR